MEILSNADIPGIFNAMWYKTILKTELSSVSAARHPNMEPRNRKLANGIVFLITHVTCRNKVTAHQYTRRNIVLQCIYLTTLYRVFL